MPEANAPMLSVVKLPEALVLLDAARADRVASVDCVRLRAGRADAEGDRGAGGPGQAGAGPLSSTCGTTNGAE